MPKILTDPKFWAAVITALFMVGNFYLGWGVDVEEAIVILVPAIILILTLAWQQGRQIDADQAYRDGRADEMDSWDDQHNKTR